MTREADAAQSTALAPDDAFGVLGNETRLGIVRALGEADEPLSFSELRERVGTRDSGQFNYHLGEVEGHFVRKSDDGYALRQAGRRVVEAVLSGAVTEAVVLEPQRLDAQCPYCAAAVEVSYREERLLVRCTECAGSYVGCTSTTGAFDALPEGTITLGYLPSGGIQERTPRDLLDTSLAWSHAELAALTGGVCPRCAGAVECSVDVCPDHDADEELCSHCNGRYAVSAGARCSNCGRRVHGAALFHLLGDARVRSFFEARGVDAVAPAWEDLAVLYDYEEDVLETEPLEARFRLTADGDELVATVDEELTVVDVETDAAAESS